MKLCELKLILSTNKITDINRISGNKFDITESPDIIKKIILKEECSKQFIKICESEVDKIEAIFNERKPFNDDQKDLISLLYEYNILSIPLEPIIKEDENEKDEDKKDEDEDEKWYGFDLDGTLATYDHWRGMEHIGEPIPQTINKLKEMINSGKKVKIMTARVAGKDGDKARSYIEDWLIKNIGQKLEITNIKDQGMEELWDDRARQVDQNSGEHIAIAAPKKLLSLISTKLDGNHKIYLKDDKLTLSVQNGEKIQDFVLENDDMIDVENTAKDIISKL